VNIKGYELIEEIGAGGMAAVWKARQLSLDRIVAIKILGKPSRPDQDALDRFKKEALIAARLNHPAIVQVYDAGEIDGEAYLVMEYVDGHTVADEILQQNGLPEARALDVAVSVAKALAYAWEKECLIHCDIKPDNILIDRNSGAIKLADLGLARMIGQLESRPDEHIFGTPHYMAPEQAAGAPDLDCRADMYALGATLYHMVTGVLPFREVQGGTSAASLEGEFLEDPQKINPTLSAPAAWLIEKLLLKNRALRPHFWTQVLKDFDQVRQGLMPFDPLPEEGCSTVRRSSARRAAPAAPAAPVAKEKPGSVKLKINRTELAAAAKHIPKPQKKLSRIGETVVSLLVISVTGLAVAYYHGRLDLSGFPALEQLLEKARALVQPAAESETIAESEDAAAPAPSPEKTSGETPSPLKSGTSWERAEFKEGARLYNEALSLYKDYQQTRANPGNLPIIEEKCRAAIEQFELCRSSAPAHVPIDTYVSQCYGLISGIRQTMSIAQAGSTEEASNTPATEKKPKITVLSSLDEPAPSAPVKIEQPVKPSTQVVAPPEPEVNLVAVQLDPSWQEKPLDTAGLADELTGLLSRYIQPASSASVDDASVLYSGIKAMMTAFEASRIIKQELPIKRNVSVPGFPANSFFSYEFEGSFSGANRLTLVVDRNNRVVMVQLSSDQPGESRSENGPASSRWRVVDFLRARQRSSDAELVNHSVRLRDKVVVVNTEVTSAPATPGSARLTTFRAQLVMPAPVAGLIVHTSR